MTLVLGIDASLTATAWALGDALGTTPGPKVVGDERIRDIHMALSFLTAPGQVVLAVLEDLPVHGHGAGKTGMAQGVVRLVLLDAGIPYATVPPATLKKFACGRGNATKGDMRLELFKRTGLDVRDDNQVDARWLMELGLHHLGHPSIELPKDRADALVKIAWPAPLAVAS